jgi:hypothetical protein
MVIDLFFWQSQEFLISVHVLLVIAYIETAQ